MSEYLSTGAVTDVGGFSIDAEDLFYSIPHSTPFVSVRECMKRNGEIGFQNASSVCIGGFLELLKFYLESTFILFNGKLYVQKKGICIGSSVAPVLCDIFLAKCDRAISEKLDDGRVCKEFRYVDDFLVLFIRGEGM